MQAQRRAGPQLWGSSLKSTERHEARTKSSVGEQRTLGWDKGVDRGSLGGAVGFPDAEAASQVTPTERSSPHCLDLEH